MVTPDMRAQLTVHPKYFDVAGAVLAVRTVPESGEVNEVGKLRRRVLAAGGHRGVWSFYDPDDVGVSPRPLRVPGSRRRSR